MCRATTNTLIAFFCLLASSMAAAPSVPVTVSDYDQGDFYLVRDGKKQSYHGMRDSWVFNRAMVWLDEKAGLDDADE